MMLAGLTKVDTQRLILSVGTHRGDRPLSPIEVAQCFRKALDSGASKEECRRTVGLSGTTMVQRFLRLLDIPEDMRHVVHWGHGGARVSFTAASHLVRLGPSQIDEALHAVVEHQLTSKEVEELAQVYQRTGHSVGQIISDIVGRRPTIERVFVFAGAIVDDAVSLALGAMTQWERDKCIARALPQVTKDHAYIDAELGQRKFTLVTRSDAAAIQLRALPGGFEDAITEAVRNAL